MKYTRTVKAWDKAHGNRDHALIVNTFDKYAKKVGLDRFESRLDVACLEIAEKLGYVFSREDDQLIFTQRGIE